MAVRERGLAGRIHVWARREEARRECVAQSWCDAVFETPEAACAGSDLTVVCAPVDAIPDLAARAATAMPAGGLVTDVGSTKARLVAAARAGMPAGCCFIGSHPMAGSEKQGLAHASSDIFPGRACLVTPVGDEPPAVLSRLLRFWDGLGMRTVTVAPDEHERIVAAVSHLPHAAAASICSWLDAKPRNWLGCMGGGLRDTTRIAAGSPELWRGIFAENRDEVVAALDGLVAHLSSLRDHLAAGDDAAVLAFLQRAKACRDEFPILPAPSALPDAAPSRKA